MLNTATNYINISVFRNTRTSSSRISSSTECWQRVIKIDGELATVDPDYLNGDIHHIYAESRTKTTRIRTQNRVIPCDECDIYQHWRSQKRSLGVCVCILLACCCDRQCAAGKTIGTKHCEWKNFWNEHCEFGFPTFPQGRTIGTNCELGFPYGSIRKNFWNDNCESRLPNAPYTKIFFFSEIE